MGGRSGESGVGELKVRGKISGYGLCTVSLTMGWTTSASSRNVAVSDQSRADTVKLRPSRASSSNSIFVNGQGPAMHETRALRNSFPCPASSDMEATAAFHFLSGEQIRVFAHGTFPLFST